MSEWSYSFEWENSQTLQEKIRLYVQDNYLPLVNKEEGAGQAAVDQAVAWTKDVMEREGCSKSVIKQQCSLLAISMLQFEIFTRMLGDTTWEA